MSDSENVGRASWLRPPQLQTTDDERALRHATWFELFYDLVFVVTIAELAYLLSHDLTWSGVGAFGVLFIPVWWSWALHTYYADRFDTDDVVYRVLTAIQMFAVGVLAVAIHEGLADGAPTFAAAFLIGRLVLIALYLRAWRHVPAARPITQRYALGYSISAGLWLISIFVPDPLRFALWGLAILIDYLSIPLSPFRPVRNYLPLDNSHLPERFGLFTIIVLGEAVVGVVAGIGGQDWDVASVSVAALGFAIAVCLWWTFFGADHEPRLERNPYLTGQIWIHAHLPLTMALAATGVGIEHLILSSPSDPLDAADRWLLAGGIAASLLTIALIHATNGRDEGSRLAAPARISAAVLVLGVALIGGALSALTIACLLAALCLLQLLAGSVEQPWTQRALPARSE